MDRQVKLSKFVVSWATFFLVLFIFNLPYSFATSNNLSHELGVYSLYEYGFAPTGMRWKSTVTPDYFTGPAGAFWDTMTGGASRDYAYHTSRRRINEEVNYRTIFPIEGDGWKDWDSFDLVFFYGHNNMITPPHACYTSHFWSNNGVTEDWEEVEGPHCEWGTSTVPYEYYWLDLRSGSWKPGAVVYLYEPFTSALLGYDFDNSPGWIIQTEAQDTPVGNSRDTILFCSGGLGTNDLEWLILHGCQAVIVANEDGSAYHPMGVDAFSRTWDGFHLILGHYNSYVPSELRDLTPFANGLLTGMPIQAAYFLTDPNTNSSAISPGWISGWGYWGIGSLFEVDKRITRIRSYFDTDTWTEPQADRSSRPSYWCARWIRRVGTEADAWEGAED